MPLYEYYCEKDDMVFEALRPLSRSEEPALCPECGRKSERILPTTFSAMNRDAGYKQRVPFHQAPVRNVGRERRQIAPLKAKGKSKSGSKGKRAKTGKG